MMIKAVFFDVGGTLETFRYTIEFRTANAHLFRDCLERGGIFLEFSDEELTGIISRGCSSYHHWNLGSTIEIPSVEIWSKYIFKDYSINHQKLSKIAEELSFLYETKFFMREMRPEVPEVLRVSSIWVTRLAASAILKASRRCLGA